MHRGHLGESEGEIKDILHITTRTNLYDIQAPGHPAGRTPEETRRLGPLTVVYGF